MPEQQCLKGLRALIIEDEYFVADDLRKILKKQGADLVKLSGTVEDAIRNIREDGFEFALVDINIRGEMTFALADEFRRRNVPFAFVSGYERRFNPRRFEDVPNWGKPYDHRQIVTGIQSLWTRPMEA